MALSIDEVMNPELASTRPGVRDDAIRDVILAFGITSVPVLDADGRPLGVVSLRDLIDPVKSNNRMTAPAITVRRTATLDEAAKVFCDSGHHHLVVVDERGIAVGMVSAVDVLRGLRGTPTRHPSAFPHHDAKLGVSWSEEGLLDPVQLHALPTYEGVIVLIYGRPNIRDATVWAESTSNIRLRMEEMLAIPQESPRLAALLARGHLRFRAACVPDAIRRHDVAKQISSELEHFQKPQARALA